MLTDSGATTRVMCLSCAFPASLCGRQNRHMGVRIQHVHCHGENEWSCQEGNGSDTEEQHRQSVADEPELTGQAQQNECKLPHLHGQRWSGRQRSSPSQAARTRV